MQVPLKRLVVLDNGTALCGVCTPPCKRHGYIADRRFRSKHQLEGLGNTHCWYGVGRAAAAVGRFVGFAKANQQQTFIVTNVCCSKKAGFYPREIAYMFETIAEHPNLYLPRSSVKKIALVM